MDIIFDSLVGDLVPFVGAASTIGSLLCSDLPRDLRGMRWLGA